MPAEARKSMPRRLDHGTRFLPLIPQDSRHDTHDLGIDTRSRKCILRSREWFKRCFHIPQIPLPARQKKYLKKEAIVELLRMKKKGLA
ncbi:MAG: hypothetical protein SGCHY_002973 [Lobulomycetales sp.]